MRDKTKILPVILSGGSGSRLWPLSREYYPKQLLSPFNKDSLLQGTAKRLEGLDLQHHEIEQLPPLVICNHEHRFLVAEQLRQCQCDNASILLEPCGRNTAPAATLAAQFAKETYDTEVVLLIMPADHLIGDQQAFQEGLGTAIGFASDSSIVTFGIVPTQPETGYGYIQRGSQRKGAFEIARFVEKPDLETAKGYLDGGDYYWNSGLFMGKAGSWLEHVAGFQKEIYTCCANAFASRTTDGDFIRINEEIFAACPSNSIDYAVMEHLEANQGIVVPLDANWSDIGAWSSIWEVMPKDDAGNICQGDVLSIDTEDSLLIAEHRLLATVGIKDVIVIETPDAVLVTDRKKAQDVRKIVSRLKDANRDEYRTHRCVYRPWGHYEGVDQGGRFQVKRITVNPGATLSLQMHYHRAEHWVVVSGTARVTRGEESFILTENQSAYIPVGETHRLENPGSVPLEIIEVQSGPYLGEDDIVRFEDDYGRS